MVFSFFLLSIAGFLLFHTQYWKNTVLSSVNNKMQKSYGLTLSATKLSGSLFTNLHFKNLQLLAASGKKLLQLESLDLSYRISSLLSGELDIQSISIDEPVFEFPNTIDSLKKYLGTKQSGRNYELPEIVIHNLTILDSRNNNKPLLSSDLFYGKISIKQGQASVFADTAQLHFYQYDETLQISDALFNFRSDSLLIENCQIKNRSTPIKIEGKINLSKPLTTNLKIETGEIYFYERLPGLTDYLQQNDNIKLSGQLRSIGKEVKTDLTFTGNFRGTNFNQGSLIAEIKNKKINVKQLSISSGHDLISGTLQSDLKKLTSAKLILENFNLDKWNLFPKTTSLSGETTLKLIGNVKSPDTLFTDINFKDSNIDNLNFNYLDGNLQYTNKILKVVDTLAIAIAGANIKFTGSADLDSGNLNATAYFTTDKQAPIYNILPIDSLKGNIEGYVNARGTLSNPILKGQAFAHNFGTPKMHFKNTHFGYEIYNLYQNKSGEISIQAINGVSSIFSNPISEFDTKVLFNNDTLTLPEINIKSEEAALSMQGIIHQFRNFSFTDIKGKYRENYITNVNPLKITITQDSLILNPVSFNLNKGSFSLSAKYIANKFQNLEFQLKNTNAKPIFAILNPSLNITGIFSGELFYNITGKTPQITCTANLDNVNLPNHSFKKINLSAQVINNNIQLNNFTIYDTLDGYLVGEGNLSCNFPKIPDSKFLNDYDLIDANISFNNFSFKTFDKYFISKQKKDGKLSGDFKITNTLLNPQINFDMTILDPIFGKISGLELRYDGYYRDSLLTFSNINMLDISGIYKGSGYLPFKINLSKGIAKLQKNSKMDMNFTFKTSSTPFMTNYIRLIETLDGDFNFALNLSGTPAKPIRSGNLNIKNGILNITPIENAITNLEGSAILTDNIMEIVSLSGNLTRPSNNGISIPARISNFFTNIFSSKKDNESQPNFTWEGSFDLTRFFKPDYNLTMKGNELYIRTLLAEQEGIVNGTLNFTGRDTININGDIIVDEFFIRNEFTKKKRVVENLPPPKVHTLINMHVIAPGKLYLKNSQLDSELEGEVWLTKNSRDPFRYSGSLDIRQGDFYYYGWKFSNLTGNIIFDPAEFNPQLNIHADLNLATYFSQESGESISGNEEEMVIVRLTGDLEKPNLLFESSQYSQSDILMILSRTSLNNDETLDASAISSSAMNIFGTYFERQLEQNIARISGLDEFKIRTQGDLFSSQGRDEWSFVVGQRIAPDFYLTYERKLSMVDPNQQLGMEYRLNKYNSIGGDIDQEGLIHINFKLKYHY